MKMASLYERFKSSGTSGGGGLHERFRKSTGFTEKPKVKTREEQIASLSPERRGLFDVAQKRADVAKEESRKAGGFWGITKETGRQLRDFGKTVLRAFPRAIFSTALEAEKQVFRGDEAQTITPRGRIGEFVFGKKPITGIKKTGERELKEFGVEEETAKKYASVAGIGLTAADLWVGTGNITKKAAKNVIKQITKQTGKKLSKQEAKNLTKQVAKEINRGILKPETGRMFSRGAEARQASKIADDIVKREVGKFINSVSDSVEYAKLLTRQREAARGATGLLGKIRGVFGGAKTKTVDFTAPIEDNFRRFQKEFGYKVRPGFNISNQIDRALTAPRIASSFTKNNGLDRIVRGVPDQDIFDQYLIAKHAKNLDSKGIKTGRNLIKDQKLIDDMGGVYEPFAKELNTYNNKLLDYMVDSGLISRETKEKLLKEYPDYVPMNRVFDEAERVAMEGGTFNSRAVASLGKQTVVKGIKGSERAIESPIESLYIKTVDTITQGEQNKAARMLSSYHRLPGWNEIIRPLPVGEKTTGKSIISALENGIKKNYEVPLEIADAAKALNVQTFGTALKILSVPTRLLKLGTTGINIAFAAANIIRDAMFSNTVSKNTTRSLMNLPRAIFEALKHGKVYDEMIEQGALHTSFDISRNFAEKTVKKVRAGKGVASKIVHTATRPQEWLRITEDIFARAEEVNRIAQFLGGKNAALSKGMRAKEASIVGAMAARENSVNFMRRGEYGQVVNALIPYLNAGIQGSRRMLREASVANTTGEKIATGAKFMMIYGIPLATITAYNLRDKKRTEVYRDIAEYEKEHNFILVSDAAEKNEKGEWEGVVKIPLTPGLGDMAQVFRKAIESVKGYDDKVFAEIAANLLESVSVVPLIEEKDGKITPDVSGMLSTITPQAIKPGLEWYTNKNFFTGAQTVPQKLQNIAPEQQFTEKTSDFAIDLGQRIGLSPLKIDAFIKGTFGSVGSQLTGRESISESVKGRFSVPTGGAIEREEISRLIEIKEESDTARTLLRRKAEELHNEFKGLPKNEANKRINQIKTSDRDLYDLIIDAKEDDDFNLTSAEKFIKRLGVENGDRAAYIHSKAMELETKEERNKYITELIKKKVVSSEVLKQIKELRRLEND